MINERERIMDKLCDLHIHSHFSDGTCSPTELIELAKRAGLQSVALTDHNSIDGLPDFLAAAEGSGVEPIPGIEFSTEYQNVELHILGLFIEPRHYDKIGQLMQQLLERKEQSNRQLVDRLNQAGYAIDFEKLKASTPNGFVNRALIAAEMTRKGYTESVKAAFKSFLAPERGYYQPPRRPDAYEIISFIKEIGAMAVLAHPFLNMDEAMLREFLPQAIACGLEGMEVLYPAYDAQTTALAQEIVRQFGILPSGGSDFHGKNKPDIQIGVGRGNLQIPMSYLDALRAKLSQK